MTFGLFFLKRMLCSLYLTVFNPLAQLVKKMSVLNTHSAPHSALTLDSPQRSRVVQHILMAEVIGNCKIQKTKTKKPEVR